jgi:hypothetical protein
VSTQVPVGGVIDWLTAGDPSVRWQTLRDLVGSPRATVERERGRVAREGWGADLLARQDRTGTWARALYSPKWISTTYTLLLLRDFGLPPNNRQARKACVILLEQGFRRDRGINYGRHDQSETCITGMVLSILSYFEHDDARLDAIANHLLEQQMADGGWNCRRSRGATHSSVHTTISALEGLRHYERYRGGARDIAAAQRHGREFLLKHRLFRSDHTGRVIKPAFTLFSFPPRWHYDVLRALDYFQSVKAPRDRRLTAAIELVRGKRQEDGRWPLQNRHAGVTFFELERVGAPSRWNTLRALRVLRWWNRGSRSSA